MFDWFRRLFGRDQAAGVESQGPEPARAPAESRLAHSAAKPDSDAASLRTKHAPQEIETVHVGLDWGTHSTKIVIRRELSERGELLVVQPSPDNSSKLHAHADAPYPWFSIPSVIGVDGERLRFGESARRLPADQRHYALKATLLKGAPELAATFAEHIGMPSRDQTVDVLAAAFVAWVLQQIRTRLDDSLGAGRWKPFVSMSAPMDRVEDPHLKARYQQILHAAYTAGFGSTGAAPDTEWELQPTVQRITQLLESVLPDEGERLFAVLPETVAGMVPVSKDPRRAAGVYNVIDIGGGTTEVSIVYLSIEGRRVIDCLADECVPTGSIDLLSFAARDQQTDPLSLIRKSLVARWTESYRLDAKSRVRRRPWKRNTVLKAGGGWVDARVQQVLNDGHPSRPYFGPPNPKENDFRLDFVLYQPSQEVLGVARSPHVPSGAGRQGFHFLPVALGLCFFPDWPDWYRPSDAIQAEPDPEGFLPPDPFHGHA